MQAEGEKIKDQIATFIGEFPVFKEMEGYLPKQKGKIIEFKDHQEDAIENLQEMRKKENLLHFYTIQRVQVRPMFL